MLSFRKFNKESDYNIMRQIVQHNCLKTGHLYPQLHIGNLDFDRYACEESPDICYTKNWILYDSKTEVGFITAEEDGYFFITALSEFKNLTQDIINYVEHDCYKQGTIVTIEANSEDKLSISTLEQGGYIYTDNLGYHGICDLSKILPHSPLPKGFSIRISQKKDIARRVELFGIPTGGIGTCAERYQRMMNSTSYCYAMDFVVVVQSNTEEIIAYCTMWDDPISKIGLLEPVACVAEYRRKGIMKSTLLYGMNLLRDSGTRYIYVGTGGKTLPHRPCIKVLVF